jgi:hypothetical protein
MKREMDGLPCKRSPLRDLFFRFEPRVQEEVQQHHDTDR